MWRKYQVNLILLTCNESDRWLGVNGCTATYSRAMIFYFSEMAVYTLALVLTKALEYEENYTNRLQDVCVSGQEEYRLTHPMKLWSPKLEHNGVKKQNKTKQINKQTNKKPTEGEIGSKPTYKLDQYEKKSLHPVQLLCFRSDVYYFTFYRLG